MGKTITAGTMGVGVLAILAGLAGAYGVRSFLKQDEPEVVAATPDLVEVPVASIDVDEGRTIGLGDISLVAMTRDEMQEKYADSLQLLMLSPDQIMGRIARQEIRQGDPFLTTSLYPEGDAPSISKLLSEGFRAASLEVPELRPGMVKVDDFVDVLFRATPRRGEEGLLAIPETTVTLLENVKVIAAEYPRLLAPASSDQPQVLDLRQRSAMSGTLPPPTITLAVKPEQSQVIQAVKGRGEITLVPRSTAEGAIPGAGLPKITLEDILAIEPPPEPEPTIVFATEIFRRGERNLNVFRDQNSVPQDEELRDLPTFDPSSLPRRAQPPEESPQP